MADQVPFQIPQGNSDLDQFNKMEVMSTSQQASDAAFELAMPETGMGLVARYLVNEELSNTGATWISPEEANQQFPGMKEPFKEEMPPVLAQHLYNEDMKRQVLEERIAKGPQDFYSKSKQFGVGILAHMMDPLEFGISSVAGWAVGGMIARTATGAKVAAALAKGTATTGQRVGFNVAEAGLGNLAENLTQEVAIAQQQGLEQREYDVESGAFNVAASTFFGMGLGVGIKESSFRIGEAKVTKDVRAIIADSKLARTLRRTSPEVDRAVVSTTVKMVEEGKVPNTERIIKALAQETDVPPAARSVEYAYTPLTAAEGKKFFGVVKTAEPREVGDGFGLGKQFTDNPSVANAAAARSMSDVHGQVGEFELSELNPLNLSQNFESMDAGAALAFHDALKAVDMDVPDLKEITPLEVLELLKTLADDSGDTAVLDGLKAKLQELGFDSTVHDGSKRLGYDHSAHNVVEVFDDSKITQTMERPADPKEIRVPTDEDQKLALEESEGNSRRKDIDVETATKELAEAADEPVVQDIEKWAEDDHTSLMEEFGALEQMGELDESLKLEFERLKGIDAELEVKDILAKAVTHCVVG